jgi:hypothetical protein
MSAGLKLAAVAPTWAVTGPPLILAVAVGVGVHSHRTRRAHR